MSMQRLVAICAGGVALSVLLASTSPARAEPTPADRAAAEVLFREAKKLFAGRKYPEACRKLEESQRLDPQGGTLLNLAVCHAREGKTASAWVEFQEAIDIAKQANRGDRVKLATVELAKLDKKLARLTIEVPAEARVPGLQISRGDERVGEGAWGTAVPVDPEVSLTLAARAPGYKEWSTATSVKAAEQKSIVIPKLEKLPRAPTEPKRAPKSDVDQERHQNGKGTERTVAYVLGGVGLVAVGVGSYFGLRAISKKGDAEKHCDGSLCDPDGLDLNEQAKTAATVSNVAFGVGVVALGVGTYFFLTSMPDKSHATPAEAEKTAIRWSPCIGPGSGAILMSGRW